MSYNIRDLLREALAAFAPTSSGMADLRALSLVPSSRIGAPRRGAAKAYLSESRYMPHQGKQECARRRRQMGLE